MRSAVPLFLAACCGLFAGAPVSAQVRPPADTHGFGERVDDARLAGSSGGTDVVSRMTLTGTVSDNVAERLVTGDNAIGGSAFEGSAGLPMVIQNTGNNVLIQNATIVNVQFQP
jgi:hypothetical protein